LVLRERRGAHQHRARGSSVRRACPSHTLRGG
jgi:hypothetical protein